MKIINKQFHYFFGKKNFVRQFMQLSIYNTSTYKKGLVLLIIKCNSIIQLQNLMLEKKMYRQIGRKEAASGNRNNQRKNQEKSHSFLFILTSLHFYAHVHVTNCFGKGFHYNLRDIIDYLLRIILKNNNNAVLIL